MKNVSPTTKRCRVCGAVKPLDDFHLNRLKDDGHCDDCRRCRQLRYRLTHSPLSRQLGRFTAEDLQEGLSAVASL